MTFIPGQDVRADAASDESADGGDPDAAFASSEKKPAASPAMLGLLGLAVAGAAAYFALWRGPPPASAVEAPPADAVAAFLDNGGQHVRLMRQMLQETDKVVQQFRAYPSKKQVPLAGLRTNPFRHAPPTADADAHRRDEERAAAGANARALKLQSILYGGGAKSCVIDNAFYQCGQVVKGFTIEQINPGSVVVRTGAFRFEITMAE